MSESSPKPPRIRKYNLTNELARERNRVAAERTLMAWIRTSLSLITFGFGIDRIAIALQNSKLQSSSNIDMVSRWVGLSFILLGVGALSAAAREHMKVLKLLSQEDYIYTRPRSIGLITAISLVSIGIFAFLTILYGIF
ncbi:MAG: hypothetical protein DCF20_02095 [Pseudanabaena sp.]|nr:MAG: hypothetical protein DCF20_02095 [Pseudanabaena sp.]